MYVIWSGGAQTFAYSCTYIHVHKLPVFAALSSPKLKPVRAGRKIEESDEDEDDVDEDDDDEDYKPDGSENEMETEMLDYM